MSKTLVIQPLPGIGDMVWHLPHLKAIAEAAPDGKVTVLTKRRSAADQMLAGVPWVSDVHWLERAQGDEPAGRHDGALGVFRLATDLKRLNVDTVWILHRSWRYAAAARLAGIPTRIGYRVLPDGGRDLHQAEKATTLLRAHGIQVDPTPRLTPPATAKKEVTRLYGDLPRPWLVLGIGASEPFKRWPEANFSALARAFTDRTGGSVILIGGTAEKESAERILQNARGNVVLAINRPIGLAAALAAAAEAFLGNDSGMLNLAAATEARVIGLFGGSPPLTLYPNLEALEPPGGAEYRVDRMAEVEVEVAMNALSRALDSTPPKPFPKR
ncbi:MAG: glycosyltransferase family 9 protein [Thalassobaculaceae bacterium]|nr:glycosyltransferase family 9 protein [Thalassobaculaceae bacterium]